MKRFIVPSTFLAASALLLTACTSPSSQTPSEGTAPASATVENVEDLRIAYFSLGSNNEYLKVGMEEAKKVGEENGVPVDVFDGQWDTKIQFDQMQTALTSGKYNAFVVGAIDGNLVCNILTEEAPAAGVLVSTLNQPICDRATNLGEETWEPGTITFVGGQTLDVYEAWIAEVMANHPEGGNIALISGPDLSANTVNFFAAAEALKDNPAFNVVAKQTTDYSAPVAFQAAQAIVEANQDLDIILSNYTGMTRGVVQATGDSQIKVYDFGGDEWALDNVASGVLSGTVMMLPRQEVREAVQATIDFVKGEDVPRFINLTESDVLPGTPFVNSENVAQFTAEY